MSRYIITGNYTPLAMKGMIASPSDREASTRPLVEAAGAKLEAYYVTTGDSDFMMIVEGPESADILPALMVAGASGTVSNLKTIRAYTSAEFTAAQKKAGQMAANFKPAG
ncbi:MAG: GYD domain-containing protein [Oricola sp.]